MTDITPVFETIVKEIKPPAVDSSQPLQMLVTTIVGDQFKGRVATGRVYNGVIKAGQEVVYINLAGVEKKAKLASLMTFDGLARVEVPEAVAGDIVAI